MEKMSRFGVGRIINLYFVGTAAVVLGLRYFFPTYFSLFGFRDELKPFAFAVIGVGVVFWLWSIVSVMKAYNADRLSTGGAYSFCRHPIYSSWALFIIPGILLLLDTGLALVFAVIMAVVIMRYGRIEEEYLSRRFGATYDEYRRRVPAVLPLGGLFSRIRGAR